MANFYERLRSNCNRKKSELYANIVREADDPDVVLTTLSAMLTQILLYGRKLDARPQFMKQARASEIAGALTRYFETYDVSEAMRLLRLIKADVKALESVRSPAAQKA